MSPSNNLNKGFISPFGDPDIFRTLQIKHELNTYKTVWATGLNRQRQFYPPEAY